MLEKERMDKIVEIESEAFKLKYKYIGKGKMSKEKIEELVEKQRE